MALAKIETGDTRWLNALARSSEEGESPHEPSARADSESLRVSESRKAVQPVSSLVRFTLDDRWRRKSGQLFGGQFVERFSFAFQSGLKSQGDLVELWRVDYRGQLGQLARVQIAEPLTEPLEFFFHAQRGVAHLGMGLGGAAQNEDLVPSCETLLLIIGRVVETKANKGGTEAARSWT